MRKIYVLDTNILLHDPLSLTSFGNNDVVIPMEVLEELDKFKTENNNLGYNARKVIKKLDKLRLSLEEGDNFSDHGSTLENGGIVYIGYPVSKRDSCPEHDFDLAVTDNKILLSAQFYVDEQRDFSIEDPKHTKRAVILVSNDAAV